MVLLKDLHLLQLNNYKYDFWEDFYLPIFLLFYLKNFTILHKKFYIIMYNIFLQFNDIILNVKIQKLNNKKFD